MRDVGMTIIRSGISTDSIDTMQRSFAERQNVNIGSVLPGAHEMPGYVSEGTYQFLIFALNGTVTEFLRMYVHEGHWDQDMTVYRWGKTLYELKGGKVTVPYKIK
jgi:hypothetical protein